MEALREYESIEGVKYRMSPTNYFHYNASKRLSMAIESRLDISKYELTQDVCLIPDSHISEMIFPDLAVFSRPISLTADGTITSIPLYIAEIVSPSSRKKDNTIKPRLYEKLGVQDYWIIDPYGKFAVAYKLNADSGAYDYIDMIQKFSPEALCAMSDEEKAGHPQMVEISSIGVQVNINDIFAD